MRVGLTFSGDMISADGAQFAQQLGVQDAVVHLTRYAGGADTSAFMAGQEAGPPTGNCIDHKLWTEEDFRDLINMLGEYGVRLTALENFSPNFWSDILLDGPKKLEQMENLKQLVKAAGRAGVPVIGYNFSIAGVWGWQRLPVGRGGALAPVFDMSTFDHQKPLADGVAWNMQVREPVPGAAPHTVDSKEIWQRLEWFLKELLPIAEEAGVKLACHPDDPPADMLRGTARTINSPEKYDRLLGLVDSQANMLEFCVGSLQEMPGCDVYETTQRFAEMGKIAYVHFRNVRGRVPHYQETFIDDGDIDMAELVRILRDADYEGVLVPDHVPDTNCAAPWHVGHGYTVGYMKALIENRHLLGPVTKPGLPENKADNAIRPLQ